MHRRTDHSGAAADWRVRLISGGLQTVWVRSNARWAVADAIPATWRDRSSPRLIHFRCDRSSAAAAELRVSACPLLIPATYPRKMTLDRDTTRRFGNASSRLAECCGFPPTPPPGSGTTAITASRRTVATRGSPRVLYTDTPVRPSLCGSVPHHVSVVDARISDAFGSTRNVPVSALDERVNQLIPMYPAVTVPPACPTRPGVKSCHL